MFCVLQTNNPRKVKILKDLGVSINGLIPVIVPSTPDSEDYLQTKVDRMGHNFDVESRIRDPKLDINDSRIHDSHISEESKSQCCQQDGSDIHESESNVTQMAER